MYNHKRYKSIIQSLSHNHINQSRYYGVISVNASSSNKIRNCRIIDTPWAKNSRDSMVAEFISVACVAINRTIEPPREASRYRNFGSTGKNSFRGSNRSSRASQRADRSIDRSIDRPNDEKRSRCVSLLLLLDREPCRFVTLLFCPSSNARNLIIRIITLVRRMIGCIYGRTISFIAGRLRRFN